MAMVDIHRAFVVLLLSSRVLLGLCAADTSDFISDEKRLYTHLMTNYSSLVRPVVSAKNQVKVVINYQIDRVVEVVEKTQTLVTSGVFIQSWSDYRLAWKAEDFGGVNILRVPVNQLWTPAVILLNNEAKYNGHVFSELAIVQRTGHVLWPAHVRFRSSCKLGMLLFPFDSHICTISFGSTTYSEDSVDLVMPDNVTARVYRKSKAWDILEGVVTRILSVSTEGKSFPQIEYSIGLKRKSIFYLYLLIFPTAILSSLPVMMFLVPPGSGQRLTLGVGVILFATLQIKVLESYLPQEMKEVPLAASYLVFIFCMSCLAVGITLFSLNCYHGKRGKMPYLVRRIFLHGLNRILCVRGEPYMMTGRDAGVRELVLRPAHASNDLQSDDTDEPDEVQTETLKTPLALNLEAIRSYLDQCTSKIAAEGTRPHGEIVIDEWQLVSLGIDRLMFLLYVIITVLVAVYYTNH